MTVKIVTDSTADLPPNIARQLDITIVPAYININGTAYRDGVDISQDELYQKITEDKFNISTSQPPPHDFIQKYRKLLTDTDQILSIHVTSKLSGIYSSALQAREMMGEGSKIEILDSISVSMGMGMIAMTAARLAHSGANLARVLEESLQVRNAMHIWGMFDTLKYVLKGGRLGKARNLISSVINVKPLITMRDGVFHPSGFARTRLKGIDKLFDNLSTFSGVEEAGVIYSTDAKEARSVRDRLATLIGEDKVYISRLGAALGVHGGPGTLALAVRENILQPMARVFDKNNERAAPLPPDYKTSGFNLSLD